MYQTKKLLIPVDTTTRSKHGHIFHIIRKQTQTIIHSSQEYIPVELCQN